MIVGINPESTTWDDARVTDTTDPGIPEFLQAIGETMAIEDYIHFGRTSNFRDHVKVIHA